MKLKLLFLFSVCALIFSCQKEIHNPPFIKIYSPLENTQVDIGDTLNISGTISSNTPITYVKIALLTTGYSQVCPAITLYPNTQNYSFNAEYIISNTNIESGIYYLYIEASNDYEKSSKYIKLAVSGIPKKSLCVIAFCHEKAKNDVKIFKVDSLLNSSLFKQLPKDFKGGAVNSKEQIIFSMGHYKGNLYSIDAESGIITNQINAIINPPFPYFESISYTNNLLLVGYYDGKIQGFYENGNLKFVYSVDNCRLKHARFDGTYILAVLEHFTGAYYYTGLIYEMSGLLKGKIQTNYKIIDLFSVNQNDVVLFCNASSQPSVRTLNKNTMVITHLKNLPDGQIKSVAQINNQNFLISHSDGLYVYSFTNNTYSKIGSTSLSGEVLFDSIDNLIYMSDGKKLYSFSYPSGNQLGTTELPDSIKKIEILYNK